MNLKILLGAAAALALTAAIPAQAAEKEHSADREFQRLDKNHDGSISRDEAKGTDHEKNFSKYDKNGDGKLSKDEFSAAEKDEHSSSGASEEREHKK